MGTHVIRNTFFDDLCKKEKSKYYIIINKKKSWTEWMTTAPCQSHNWFQKKFLSPWLLYPTLLCFLESNIMYYVPKCTILELQLILRVPSFFLSFISTVTHQCYLRCNFSCINCKLTRSIVASTAMLHWRQTPKSLDFQCLQRFVEAFWLEMLMANFYSTFKILGTIGRFLQFFGHLLLL